MGYELYFDDDFFESIEKFPLNVREIIFSKIDFLENNPDHVSLRTEPLYRGAKGAKREIRSSSISKGIRLIWQIRNNKIRIIDVGKHDIYRKYKAKKLKFPPGFD